jgi:anthranilate synthase component 2
MSKILFIDNFDSFTYNLVDEFRKRGCDVDVYRNNVPLSRINEVVNEERPDLMVLSPGPSTPSSAGNCLQLVQDYKEVLPIFGVCLGEQAIIEALGGKVGKSIETLHGKASTVHHDQEGIFKGLENPLSAGRYHSLSGQEIPEELVVTARTDSDVVMGIRHRSLQLTGIQFHPESILTPAGGQIIENVLSMTAQTVQS